MTRSLSLLALLLAIALGIGVPAPSEALKLSPTVTVLRGAPERGRETGGGQALGLQGDASPICVETDRDSRLDRRGLAPSNGSGAERPESTTQWFPSCEVPAVIAVVTSGAPTPTGSVGTALLGGWISWADPDLGGDYLATRFPRGTLVRLCTPNRCIVRRSNDFGPSAKIDPPRIADLAVLDWESLCGLPRARGVCRGTIEAIDDLPLPPTDTETP